MDAFVRSYLETAAWAEDAAADAAWSPEAITRAAEDCARFVAALNTAALGDWATHDHTPHDFWLTRNHHGAGFWDGDYPEPDASHLTAIASGFGACQVYLGDDGALYFE